MKKKFLILILVVLAVLSLSCIAGCSLFGGFGDGDRGDNGDPPVSDASDLKAPEWVRLDLRWKELYVPDCSESGVTYYEIIQDWGTGSATLRTLDTVATKYPNYDGETECYIFDVSAMVDATSFSLTVKCKAKASDSQSVSKTFEFVEGEAIIYDKEHCTFDNDTGLFTWTKVDGAVGYMINGVMYVEEPKYTVPSTVNSITVAPLYDTNKIGVPVTVSFGSVRPDIKYDAQTERFIWSDVADSYIMEITDGDETHTFELTETSIHYVPVTDHIYVKLTTVTALRRNGVTTGELDCLPRVAAISVDKFSRLVSWTAIPGISEYDVTVDTGDGEPTYKRLSTNSITLENVSVGTVTVKIKAFDSSRPTMISFYNEFTVRVFPAVQALSPSLSYDSENEKLTLSFDTDADTVEKYTVMLTMNTYTTTDVYPDETDAARFEVDLAPYRMGNILITRDFKDGDGTYCYVSAGDLSFYTKSVIYIPAPEVHLIDDNADYTSGRAFKIGVKYPTELAGIRGTLSLSYSYSYTSRTVTMSADREITFPLANSAQKLTVNFSSFATGSNMQMFTDGFETTVSSLSVVSISADAQKLSWTEAIGATGYIVEELIGGQYTEVQRGADTEYLHGIDTHGYTHMYRVIAVGDESNPFIFDSYTDDYNVMKLGKPYVSRFTAEGKITFTAATDSTIVTVLDGTAVTLTDAVIRNALTGKTSATLLTYATRENEPNTTYIDSDTDTYTFSRIPDVDIGGLNLKVNAATGTVSWSEPENADDCTRLLYRKTSEAEEYTLYKECDDIASELDGSELPYGLYELSVRPASRRDGNTFYMYYGDVVSDTFRKDGVRSVELLADGEGFAIDGFIASGDYNVSWAISSNYEHNKSYTFAMGDSIVISQNADFQRLVMSGFQRSTYTLTFNVDYGDADAILGADKTLKASGYPVPLTIKESSVGDFSGKYSYVERQYNSQPVQIAVTLTPDDYVLKSIESYVVFYRVNSGTVSETPGNEVTVTVSGYHNIQRFYLGIKSDKFTEEDGAAVFYRSTDVSFSTGFNWYDVALQEAVSPTATNVAHDSSNKKVSFSVTMNGMSEYFNGEKFTFEYLAEDGTWITACQYTLTSNTKRFDVTFNYSAVPKATSDGQISIRMRWDERTMDGVKYEASAWSFITITLS
ncbi:MAG: hypothetical protein J1F39_03870 [Clostridiales bacterium]|nr:hypothetical protein [Clostridiales bacterium]